MSASGYEAARKYWPEEFQDAAARPAIMAGLAAARPRLVKGFEAMVMARLIAQDPSGAVVERMLAGWPEEMLEETLAAWAESADDLAAAFEAQRAAQMRDDFGGFAASNALYPGVGQAMADCESPFYIASSKSGRRLIPLLNYHFQMGVEDPSPRVFHSLIPPNEQKIAALRCGGRLLGAAWWWGCTAKGNSKGAGPPPPGPGNVRRLTPAPAPPACPRSQKRDAAANVPGPRLHPALCG